LYSVNQPVVSYDDNEIGWPFKDGSSIWDLCTGMVGQIFFTLPVLKLTSDEYDQAWSLKTIVQDNMPEFDPLMPPDYDGVPMQANETSVIEKYVRQLLQDAYSNSPLYWHYAMRYVPSDSLVCLDDYSRNVAPANSKIQIQSLQINSTSIGPSILAMLSNVDLLGYAAFPLGDNGCYCGWTNPQKSGWCTPPNSTKLCELAGMAHNCTYIPMSTDERKIVLAAEDAWDNSWACPESDFSDAWGFIPQNSVNFWLQHPPPSYMTAEISELLSNGRVGIRAGSLTGMLRAGRAAGINPTMRVHKIRSAETGDTLAMKNCVKSVLKNINVRDLTVQVVDDLFPVSQGKFGSASNLTKCVCLTSKPTKGETKCVCVPHHRNKRAHACSLLPEIQRGTCQISNCQNAGYHWSEFCGERKFLLHLEEKVLSAA
jgi:hypothetical protein